MLSSKFRNPAATAPRWLTAQPFAHRGLHDPVRLAENSLGAFEAALQSGYGIELDVQLTADGAAAVFHDADLKRLAGQPLRLADLTLADLRQHRLLIGGEGIPDLAEVLDRVAGRVPVLVEVKSQPRGTGPLERAVVEVIDGYAGPLAVMSFNPGCLAWFRTHRPHVTLGFVASLRYRRELGWRLTTIAGQTKVIEAAAPDFVAYDIRCLPNALTRALRRRGVPLLTWTVRTAAHRQRARVHADNIIFEQS